MERGFGKTEISRYVGIPWRWGGYDTDGTFCWGLLWLVQKEVFGRTLPKLDMAMRSTLCNDLDIAYQWLTGQVGGPRLRAVDHSEAMAGDALTMHGDITRNRFRSVHVGCYVSPTEVLHIEEGGSSMIEKTHSKRFQWRRITTYRIL